MKVDFKNLDVSWEGNALDCKQPQRLPECVDDNFLIWILGKPNRGDFYSDHALIEFVILRRVGLAKTKAKWFLHN